MRGITDTVKHLLIINGIFFFAKGILGEVFTEQMALAFLSQSFFSNMAACNPYVYAWKLVSASPF